MIAPLIPENESQRLKALQNHKILDTLPEDDYDSITLLASIICETPISTITLIDANRQFFKSSRGLEGEPAPRELSFCAHAINTPNDLMIVPDSRLDERFADNPLVIGEPHVIFYSGIPLVTSNGLALGALCVIDNKPHQITETQQEALKALGKQVTRLLELRHKNEVLKSQQKQLELLAKDMEMFAYIASHDLREPLRMVKSFVGLLEKKYSTQLDDTARKYIRFAVDGSARMDNLITDLLAYFTAGNMEIHNELTDVNSVIEEVQKLYEPNIKEVGALITFDSLPIVNMSRVALSQIFQNLISNSIKYQSKGSQPVIHISVKDEDTHWQFSIRDNGIGISEENFDNIFVMFKRLHNKQDYSGTGIGLSIIKRIIEQNNGKIWVESQKGQGCTIYFTMPKLAIPLAMNNN